LSSMTFLFALFLGGGRNIFPCPHFICPNQCFLMWWNFIIFWKKMWPTTTTQSIFLVKKNGLKFAKFQTNCFFFFNCQISTIGYSTCSHINEGFLKNSTMSSLVEPWQNIGIYDCQLNKVENSKIK
jgi:hypothetical protein